MNKSDEVFKNNLKAMKAFKIGDNVYVIHDNGKPSERIDFGYISGITVNCHNAINFVITIPKYSTETYQSYDSNITLNPFNGMTKMVKI